MRLTTGCPCAISVTETRHYLILWFHGDHNQERHTSPMISGRKSGPAHCAFKSYISSWVDAKNVESCMSLHDFFLHCIALPSPPHFRVRRAESAADGGQCIARRLASNVLFYIMNAPVVGSPIPLRDSPAILILRTLA
jgi:hypothetical protein